MKITLEHYNTIKNAIAILPLADIEKAVKEDGRYKDYDTRLAWDCFHIANLTRFACDTLYTYLDDTHINTAVKRVIKELKAA